jgi:hypothetical protein
MSERRYELAEGCVVMNGGTMRHALGDLFDLFRRSHDRKRPAVLSESCTARQRRHA